MKKPSGVLGIKNVHEWTPKEKAREAGNVFI